MTDAVHTVLIVAGVFALGAGTVVLITMMVSAIGNLFNRNNRK